MKDRTTQTVCALLADGHILGTNQWTYRDGNYWVLMDDQWVQVQHNEDIAETGSLVGGNPTGGAVAWWRSGMLFCFVPPPQG